ncbi:DUF4855 domain-containing protein [Bacteroides faecis]|nr:DUF4855 domain-containing protein [Bacteroides faecis]
MRNTPFLFFQKTAVEKLKLSPTRNTIGKPTVSQSWLIPIWYFFYSGGDQRPIWTQERAQPYITYVDEQNTSHWFFDSFLMLEILNTSDNWQTVREYTKGMRYESATKAEWMKLIDCYFNSETGIAAIEAGVKKSNDYHWGTCVQTPGNNWHS